MTSTETPLTDRKIFSVSELNLEIKRILETKYAFIWISGEVSNFTKAASGHIYLTLKDRSAQIAAVIFRTQTRLLHQKIANGMKVTGFGRISVYEPKGTYQIILEYLEESGIGALLAEQEALKNKLKSEGLFEVDHKKQIPFLPVKIAVITSPTGAAIEDILTIAERRFDTTPIEVVPVAVQGERAADEIAAALALVHERGSADVIILARGGGSVEDLRAFNSEKVARAIFDAVIPVVSAVGHETDYTIADFVADLRAPTPSAAVELVLPVKKDLALHIEATHLRLVNRMRRLLEMSRQRLAQLEMRVGHPRKKLDDAMLRMDELQDRLAWTMNSKMRQYEIQLNWWTERIMVSRPDRHVKRLDERLKGLQAELVRIGQSMIAFQRNRLQAAHSALNALSPKAVLRRGFSITRTLPQKEIVRSVDQVKPEDELEIILDRGVLQVKNVPRHDD